MYCSSCGTHNDDNNFRCVQCGHVIQGQGAPGPVVTPPAYQEPVPNHLLLSILTTVLCCMPLGIVAIVFAAQVDSKRNAGDIDGAWVASKRANLFASLALISGILIVLVYGVFMFLLAASR